MSLSGRGRREEQQAGVPRTRKRQTTRFEFVEHACVSMSIAPNESLGSEMFFMPSWSFNRLPGRGELDSAGMTMRDAPSGRLADPGLPAAPPGVMLERVCGQINTLLACGMAREENDGAITLVLRDAERAQGGMITIAMNVEIWCPHCTVQDGDTLHKAERNRATTCPKCAGRGRMNQLFSAWLAVPPGVVSGTALHPTVTLDGMIEQVKFRVGEKERER
jgi:hypothetical protein